MAAARPAGAAYVADPTPLADWLIVAPTVITVLAGCLLLLLRRRPRLQPPVAVAALALLVAGNALLLLRVARDGPFTMTMGRWLPPFGISFTADLFGAILAFVASLAALAVAVYAARDIEVGLRRYGFYPFLALLMTGVCGAFLTGDIFNLYVWFEVLLIASFGMLVLGNSREQLDGALRYAILNLIATTLFLVATGYLYGVVGTLNMADIVLKLRDLGDGAPVATIAALFLLAFGMKAAAFPVNFWLPASYHTPQAATSALFAGLLTKVGIYALIRVAVMLMPAERTRYAELLAGVAIATIVVGGLGAVAQSDLRRMLGYLVIGGIGAMLAGLALGSPGGLAGAVVYAVHSMIVMTGLYLAVGVAGRIGGGFEARRLGGLYAASPLLSAIVLVLIFAVAGLPPFSGFWPKLLITRAALAEGRWLLAAAVLASGFLAATAAVRLFGQAFWRGGPAGTPDGGEAATLPALPAGDRAVLLAPLMLLAGLAVLIGLWPAPLLSLAERAAVGLLDPAAYVGSVFGEAP